MINFLIDKDFYLFKVDENNIVTDRIVFNEKNCGKKLEQFINDSGENWIASDLPVGGQYYPEYGALFTAEIKPVFKKEHLWHISKIRMWEPKLPKPDDGKKYQFCEDCERWVEFKCC